MSSLWLVLELRCWFSLLAKGFLALFCTTTSLLLLACFSTTETLSKIHTHITGLRIYRCLYAETIKYVKNRQPCSTNLPTLLVIHYSNRFHSIPRAEIMKNHVSQSIRTHYMPKMLKYGKSGNPVVQIWKPCLSDIILRASI